MTLTCVDRLVDLEAHGEAWDALAARLPVCLPMLTHAWVATFFERTNTPDGSWLAVLAHDGDELVGVLVGRVERGLLRVPCDYHTEDGDVVLAPGREAEVLPRLLGELRAQRPDVQAISLGGVRESSGTNAALEAGLEGWTFVRDRAVQGSSFPIHGDAETWFRGLSKHLRGDLRRSRNKLRKAGFEEPTLRFDEGAAAAPGRLEDLMRLEASGWKGEEGSAIATNEDTEAKYRGLAQRFAAHGMLEWHDLLLGERLAAMHMCVRMGEDLMLLRQGFDHELRDFSVGNLLLQAAIEREHERRSSGEMNLVTDYPWCRRWRTQLSRYDRVLLARRRPAAWMRRVLPLRLRRWAREAPGLSRAVRWARSRRGAGAEGPTSR